MIYITRSKNMAKKNKEKPNEIVEENVSPEEEQKKLDQSLDLIYLCQEKSEVPFNEAVEEQRKNIFVTYKKANTKNNIIMVGVVIVMIVSLVLFVNFPGWGQITGGVLIGCAILFLIINFILTKNLFPNTTKNYIKFFLTTSDNYVFDIPEVKDQKLYFEKRYAMSDVLGDRAYKDVIDIASRNIVSATYKGHGFECGELALYKAGAKRNQKAVIFVGKYLSLQNDLHFEDRYIIQIKNGEKETDAPTDIEDLVQLHAQNNFVVYGKEGRNFEKDLGKELVNNLKSIECVGALVNANFVFWAGHTAAYLSYDDTIAAIPFDKEIVTASYTQLKNNIRSVLEILIEK